MARWTRRRFVAALASSGAAAGLAGCLTTGLPGANRPPDRTVYVGAYHWGFVVVDETGTERERLVFDAGTRIALVAFSTRAEAAIARLPATVRNGLPDHEALEGRNADRIPAPPTGTMAEALEVADERYPDHSLAVMPAGYNDMPGPMGSGPWGSGSSGVSGGMGGGVGGSMGGVGGSMGGGTSGVMGSQSDGEPWAQTVGDGVEQMGGGMMLRPIPLPHDATRPTTAGLLANARGDYTLTCLTYCGYGHPYMNLDGAFVVR